MPTTSHTGSSSDARPAVDAAGERHDGRGDEHGDGHPRDPAGAHQPAGRGDDPPGGGADRVGDLVGVVLDGVEQGAHLVGTRDVAGPGQVPARARAFAGAEAAGEAGDGLVGGGGEVLGGVARVASLQDVGEQSQRR